MTATNEAERKRHLREFQRSAQRFLTDDDRDYLHDIMKEYQAHKSVEKLIQALKSCLDTPRKLDLLADIRNLIPLPQLSRFDSLAPYHKMAHPYRPENQISPERKTQSLHLQNGQHRELHENGRVSPGGSPGSFKVITLARTSPEQVLGFSVQGGRERGSSVYVSEVDSGCLAEKQGLCVADKIIEVNGISFEHIALSSAVNLLTSIKKIKMVVKSQGKMPDFSDGMSRKSPRNGSNGGASPDGNNGSLQNSSTSSTSSHTNITLQPNSHLLNSDDERRVNLVVESTPAGFIGFTLRGGSEYGLGLFVSGVDPGSLAEQKGFRVGDQILDVNGKSFEDVKHKDAVDFIKSNTHIIATLKAVGKLPEAQHYTSEISWIYPDGTIVKEGKENFTRSLSTPSTPVSPLDLSSSSSQFPDFEKDNIRMESPKPEQREFGVQTPELSPNGRIDSNTQTLDVVPVRDVQGLNEDLEMKQSVATLCSSSSAETEKRQSVHSGSYSIDSTNSKEDLERRYLSASLGASSGENIHMTASDSEVMMKDESKRKVKKSKSFLQKHGDKIRSKLSFRKKSKPKMEQRGGGPSKQQLLLYVEERAKKILVVDEYNEIIKHLKQYTDNSDVETLVHNLLAILDKPEKALLLRDVRTLISSYDLGRFDAMVSAREKAALEYLSVCVPGSPSILPTAVEKPKRQLISVIQDSRGGFQIRSKEELERIKKEKEREEHAKAGGRAWLGGNILDRQARIGTSEYYAVQSTTPEAIEMVPGKDTHMTPVENPYTSTPSPMTLHVPVIQLNNDESDEQDVPMETASSSNTLLVPDRVAVEYKEDEEEDDVPIGGSQSAFVAVPSSSQVAPSGAENLILLPKSRTSLGISISGGKGSKTQPEIRVEKIFPGGAAHDDARLKSGDEITSVDNTSMRDVTHAEAVDIIRRSYNDKSKGAMQITVIPKQ